VAADLVQDPKTGVSYYTARVATSPDELARLDGLTLVPGMPVEAFIQTGERTALSYLAKPLSDQMSRAFKGD
jgi:HlyD family secretion protein